MNELQFKLACLFVYNQQSRVEDFIRFSWVLISKYAVDIYIF